MLARQVKRLPADGEHRHPRRVAQQRADQRHAPADHVLARVEDEQHVAVAQVPDRRVRTGAGVLL